MSAPARCYTHSCGRCWVCRAFGDRPGLTWPRDELAERRAKAKLPEGMTEEEARRLVRQLFEELDRER